MRCGVSSVNCRRPADNTLLIAERANVEIEFGKPATGPTSPFPRGSPTDTDYLRHLTMEGARERWGANVPDTVVDRFGVRAEGSSTTWGSASYFLIVWDLIRHARQSNIRVVPGRGSAAGLRGRVYCLRITDLGSDQVRPAVRALSQPVGASRCRTSTWDFDSRYRDEMIPLRIRALRP